jgi:Ca-activated chloride channel family protein
MSDSQQSNESRETPGSGVNVVLEPRPERRLLRAAGSSSYVDFVVRVTESAAREQPERLPLHVALVIDRSGSMGGGKVETAKTAALAVLSRLTERDTAAVVVFDDHIDTVQAEAPVTQLLRAHVVAELERINARGSTALHEGWLIGCRTIAAEARSSEPADGVRRCFLLTDGQANVGVTDPRQIAEEAVGVREHAGVGTSTFGIGDDYDEEVLGPLAEAGGGQFHHLRTPAEITTTFIGELEQMLGVAAQGAQLEIQAEPGVDLEVVSAYVVRAGAAGSARWSVGLGDLLSGDERHVVAQFKFPARGSGDDETPAVRARLTWRDETGDHESTWQSANFRYAASDAEWEAEPRDETVLHFAAQHLSDRTQRESIRLRKQGDLAGSGQLRQMAVFSLGKMLPPGDAIRLAEEHELQQMDDDTGVAFNPARAKERYFRAQSRASGKRDLRGPSDANGPQSPPKPPDAQ